MIRWLIEFKKGTYPFRRKFTKNMLALWYWRDKWPYYLGLKKCPPNGMPDFIIAGLPKCGTVWMVRVLRSDNQLQYFENPFFKNKGEIRFFSRNFNQPIKKYFAVFADEIRDPAKLAYEKSPDYSIMPKRRIKLLKKLNPELKIILVFRDPIERAHSNAKMDLSRRGINVLPENEGYYLEHYKSQANQYNYEKIINNWKSLFGKDKLLILSQEDIGEKPSKVIKKIYSFLGRDMGIEHDIFENPNATSKKPIPISHQMFLKKHIASIIKYWEDNQVLFRLD